MTLRTRSVELPGRVRLAYVEQGEPSGVPMLMLHGITDSWRSFEPVLPRLPASVHLFALSLRGHGDSDRPASGYQPDELAADVAAFMDVLGIGPAVIVGHSMGSYIAQRFAIDYPERTSNLVLMGSFLRLQSFQGAVQFWEDDLSRLTDPIDPAFALAFQESTLAQPIPQAFLDTVVQESLKVPARIWQAAWKGLMEADHSGEIGSITAPTLIAWGDQDAYFLRTDQEALAAAIKDAQLLIYEGAGHALHWEEPERFAADLMAFVDGHASASASKVHSPSPAQSDDRSSSRLLRCA
jgi:non-heme chloroperoxidase